MTGIRQLQRKCAHPLASEYLRRRNDRWPRVVKAIGDRCQRTPSTKIVFYYLHTSIQVAAYNLQATRLRRLTVPQDDDVATTRPTDYPFETSMPQRVLVFSRAVMDGFRIFVLL